MSNQRKALGRGTVALAGGACAGAGGSLGGNVDCFQSTAELTISGTGSLQLSDRMRETQRIPWTF